MKHSWKKLLALLLTLAMIVSLFPAAALAEDGEGTIAPVTEAEDLPEAEPDALPAEPAADEIQASGECGDDLTWTLDETGTLTISGTGDMWDYEYAGPWCDRSSDIKSVRILSGVTSIGKYAFCDCSSLTEVAISEGVTSIGDWAFRGCSSLTGITVPDSVTSLGYSAFYGCSSLTSITIPGSVTKIGFQAFYGCSSLTSITIPGSVTSIGNYAFQNCSSLTEITIPEGVTSIGDSAFYGCRSLTEITIPGSVTSIGIGIFCGCSELELVTLPSAILSIETAMFSSCSSLTEITIPGSVTSIGEYTFSYCTSLMEVAIPGSVTSIGEYAFSNCSSLTEIIFAGSAPEIGNDCFSDVTATAYYPANDPSWTEDVRQNFGGNLTWESYEPAAVVASGKCGANLTWTLDETGTLTVSGTGKMNDYYELDEDREREWAPAPWYTSYKDQVTRVVVEEGATSIGLYAFKNMDRVTEVHLPSSLQTIYGYAFEGCTALQSLELLPGLTTISTNAFQGCAALSALELPAGLVTLYYGAFQNCSGLLNVTIPEGVTSIGSYTFNGCSGLKTLSLPASVNTIGDEAFGNCTSLDGIYISDLSAWCGITFSEHGSANPLYQREYGAATQRDVGLYLNGEKITDLVIPADVTSISPRAFFGYTGLESVEIPDTVTTVGASAFSNCVNLTDASVSAAIVGDSAFEYCEALRTVSLGAGVTGIGRYVFEYCSALESINIPAAVKSIGNSAFLGCGSLQRVDITDLAAWCGVSFSTGAWGEPNYGSCYSNPLCNSDACLYLNGRKLEKATIPDGVTSISPYAFYCCRDLVLVSLPATLRSVGRSAFSSCGKLTDVYYQGTQEDWSSVSVNDYNYPLTDANFHFQAIAGPCGDDLTWVLDADGLLTVSGTGEMWDFQSTDHTPWADWWDSITEVLLEEGVTGVGDNAFRGCWRIGNVTLPDSLKHIGASSFEDNDTLQTLILPEGLLSIGDSAFNHCSKLEALCLPSSIQRVDAFAFSECASLRGTVFLPEGLTEIGDAAFDSLFDMFQVDDANPAYTAVDGVLYDKDVTTMLQYPGGKEGSLTVPASVTEIKSWMFWSAAGLNELVFTGDAPEMAEGCIRETVTMAFYPADAAGWTEEYRQSRGPRTTWVAYEHVQAPEITVQPADQTCKAGQTASFSVEATGGELSYQWYYQKPGSEAWNAVSAAAGKQATYTLSTAARHNGYRYKCVVTNSAGSAESSVALLTVYAKPVIRTQPADQTVMIGQTAGFSVEAEGLDLSYKWYYRTSAEASWTAVHTNGSAAVYALTAAERHNGYQYRCRVTNPAGTTYSKIVTLTVNPAAKPVIVTQPQSVTAEIGKTVHFTVAAEGTGLSYQWYYRLPGTTAWKAASSTSAKTAEYSLKPAERHNGYQYRCKVTNSAGYVYTKAVTLTVAGAAPVIQTQPKDASVAAGEKASFTVKAVGTDLSYQWQFRTGETGTWKNVSAASGKTANYSLTAAERHNGYQYQCVVTNPQGSATSTFATLTVTPAA